MYCYCLFCETVKCDGIALRAQKQFDCRAISPKQIQHIRIKGESRDVERNLLPGYVFLYFEEAVKTVNDFRTLPGVLRCLCQTEKQPELSGADKSFALMLLEKGGVLGKTRVYREGQLIRLCDGAFEGLQAAILKVDRHSSRMQIELPFAGRPLRTWVEFELAQPANELEELRDEGNQSPEASRGGEVPTDEQITV